MNLDLDSLVTVERAAEVLQLRPSTVKRWLRTGRIRCELLVLRSRAVPYVVPRQVLEDAAR